MTKAIRVEGNKILGIKRGKYFVFTSKKDYGFFASYQEALKTYKILSI